jgi:hypothetical protein
MRRSSVADFTLDLSKFVAKAKGNTELVVKKVAVDLLSRVVQRTPVGNPSLWKSKPPAGYVGGRLRANWNVSIGTPDFSVSATIDANGAPTVERGLAALGPLKGEADVYIMNSLPYVRPIEYEGHSKQAPAGMVQITVAEFQTVVAKAAAEVAT